VRESYETQAEDDDAGETVVVDRTPMVEEGTVVVDRSPAAEEGTVVVDRSVPDEGTVVIDRSSPDEGTVVIERRRDGAQRTPPRSSSVLGALPRRGRRRELTHAPGDESVNRTAVLASGPGAVTAYTPRAIPDPPTISAVTEAGPEATRADAPSMPSVARSATRWSRTALAAFAGACVVSVAGLIVLFVLLTAG
jgi:hypothetical protein